MILLTNHDEKFINILKGCLRECLECKIAVAYIRNSGVNPIITALENLQKKGGKIKILTSDQMGITERDAIESLLEIGAEIKVFVDLKKVFHPKAYIFKGSKKSEYILGSSNISRSAFFDGVEWNLFFDSSNPVAADLDKNFERLWVSSDVQVVNKDNLQSFFNSNGDQITNSFAAKEDAVIPGSPKNLKELIAKNVIYPVTKRADNNSTWNYNLSVNKVNKLLNQGPFYVIIHCNFESDDEIIFAISSEHLKSQIFPYSNQGKSSRYLFEISKRTLQFNWQRSIKMDGKPFVIS